MGIKLIKKESMERCDSCGAVMTEYEYDRYGGLCKYCRDRGKAKKPDESKKQEYRVKSLHDSVDALVKQGFDKGLLHDIILEMVDMGCDKDYITRHFDNLLDGDFLGFCVKKGLTPYQIAIKLSNMGA